MNSSTHSKASVLLGAVAALVVAAVALPPSASGPVIPQYALAAIIIVCLCGVAYLQWRCQVDAKATIDSCLRNAKTADVKLPEDCFKRPVNEVVGQLFGSMRDSIIQIRNADQVLRHGLKQLETLEAGEPIDDIPIALLPLAKRLATNSSTQPNESEVVSYITKVCTDVVRGDLNARLLKIPQGSQFEALMNSINDLIDRSDAFVREAGASLQYVSENKYYRSIIETGMLGAYLKAAQTVNLAVTTIKQKMGGFKEVSSAFETKMNSVVMSLGSSASSLKSNAQRMTESAAESDEKCSRVATAAEQAANNVQSVSAATEELSSSINEISRRVGEQSAVTNTAVKEATSASDMVKQLDAAAAKIGEVVQLISDIAEQTNLLALNATIEAARAGDAGRGFAVVAGEVKNLANQTAKATEEIGEQIDGIQAATKRSVQAIEGIFSTISKVNEISTTIASAVEEQSAATSEIARNIEEVASGTQSVTTEIRHVTEAAARTKSAAAEVLSAADGLGSQSSMVGSEMTTFGEALKKII